MKVRLPILVQDRLTTARKGIEPFEFYTVNKPNFLNGPVCDQVAILDFDEKGRVVKGARFIPPKEGHVTGRYDVDQALASGDITQRSLNQVSVFAAIMKTIGMFEHADALGRPIRWAFDAPQLLVIPRAGRWANAFYERDTHSLQFFWFENPNNPSDKIYTSLSLDIVAHETTHAILDGIIPSLYDSVSPQSLAMHEAIADLGAVIVALDSDALVDGVLRQTGGSIACSTAFSSLAEECGSMMEDTSRLGYLRNLINHMNLDPADAENYVGSTEEHDLSQVLSGALYKLMVDMHEDLKAGYRRQAGPDADIIPIAGKAIGIARERFRRMLLRALDYVPIGDASFADYARAIIASDQVAYPDHPEESECIRDEFVRRKIVSNRSQLDVEVDEDAWKKALKGITVDNLRDSEWIAYQFAEKNRPLLSIPPDASYKIEPRLDVTKSYPHLREDTLTRELIFKVSWTQVEPNPVGSQFPSNRRIKVGTTLSIERDPENGNAPKVRVMLTSGQNRFKSEAEQQRASRDVFLTNLVKRGYLVPEEEAIGPDGKMLRTVIGAENINGSMRVRNMARMLHIIEGR